MASSTSRFITSCPHKIQKVVFLPRLSYKTHYVNTAFVSVPVTFHEPLFQFHTNLLAKCVKQELLLLFAAQSFGQKRAEPGILNKAWTVSGVPNKTLLFPSGLYHLLNSAHLPCENSKICPFKIVFCFHRWLPANASDSEKR